jgi:DNA (cytosine-5)-methyltransferase 3A
MKNYYWQINPDLHSEVGWVKLNSKDINTVLISHRGNHFRLPRKAAKSFINTIKKCSDFIESEWSISEPLEEGYSCYLYHMNITQFPTPLQKFSRRKYLRNVVGLFDGLSAGQQALKEEGFVVGSYTASEIDVHAIAIANYNFPKMINLGDVLDVKSEQLGKVDLLMGGSPCQSFSVLGTRKGFEGKSGLFSEFLRVKEETNPTYWLYENVVMRNSWREIISEALGVKPFKINSALVSGQNRNRYYWTNIPVTSLPKDKGISMEDVLEPLDEVDPKHFLSERGVMRIVEKQINVGKVLMSVKAKCLFASYHKGYTSREAQIVYYADDISLMRKLTPKEFERLQTFPDDYSRVLFKGKVISDTQRYRALGNSWTVGIIRHLLSYIPNRY